MTAISSPAPTGAHTWRARWHALRAAMACYFHAFGAWLVRLSGWRFFLISISLRILASIASAFFDGDSEYRRVHSQAVPNKIKPATPEETSPAALVSPLPFLINWVRYERVTPVGGNSMINTSLRWIARLIFLAVVLALAAAIVGGLHGQPDVMLSVNGQALTLPAVASMAIGAAVLVGLLVLLTLAVLPLLVLLLPVCAVLVVMALIAAGLGVLSIVLWGLLPLLMVWLIWRLAFGGAKGGRSV